VSERQPRLAETAGDADSRRFCNLIVADMSTVEVLAWQRLASALLTLEPNLQLPDRLKPFKEWISRVARFSFHTGRLVAAEYLPERPTASSLSIKEERGLPG
jgi:hypothetical protein